MPLKDKIAIITGGSRGIGRAIVTAMARQGAQCVFTYEKNRGHAESLAAEIGQSNRSAVAIKMDVRDFHGAKELVETVKDRFGRIDILVNNAGITRDKSLLMMSREDWSDVIDTDLTGVFNTTRACITTFLRQRSGNIINISSVNGVHPLPGQTNYAAAKAGVIGFTKSLAKEVAAYNIRVNAVAPGFIETDMTSQLDDANRGKYIEMIPVRKFGTSEDVANAALFLAGDGAGYITGQVIQIDGGLGM